MTIKTFEEIEAWQKARVLAQQLRDLIQREPFRRDFPLRDQIVRSCASIMDNIAEGFERDGRNEFIQFLSYAKGSSGETRSQLYRALDNKYITPEEFENLKKECIQISGMLASFISYLKKSDFKGTKFKDRQPT